MIKLGTTRLVIVIESIVIKIPIFWRGVKIFAKGWLGNLDERILYKSLSRETKLKLAPTWISLLGFINFMGKAEDYKFNPNISDEDNAKILLTYFDDLPMEIDICSRAKNFGLYKKKLVILDYAVGRESSTECDNCYCKNL